MVTRSMSLKKPNKVCQSILTTLIKVPGKNIDNVRITERLIVVGLGFAAAFWILESIVDVVLFNKGTLIEQILTPSLPDIWMRTLVICTLIMFGVYAQSIIDGRNRVEKEREALLEDIKEVNHRLEQSNHELQDFAYIASHDLQEPLRKITSFGSLLHDSLEGQLDDDQQENLNFMIDGTRRMQAMIDDLLTYSRLTTKARPSERVDLNNVIENLKNLELATLLDETNGTITVMEPLPPVQAEASQMSQLFQNLIGNGLKFHKEGIPPEITIRARQLENAMVRVEVHDNGIGIAEEYHEQIFTMFKRLHSRANYEGTGIGLAICKKVVNRHGGNIGISSTPGNGATFWFTLPGQN